MFCPVSDAVQVICIRVVSCPDPFRKNQEGLVVWHAISIRAGQSSRNPLTFRIMIIYIFILLKHSVQTQISD